MEEEESVRVRKQERKKGKRVSSKGSEWREKENIRGENRERRKDFISESVESPCRDEGPTTMTEGGLDVCNLMTKNKRTNWRRLLAGGLVAIVALALVVAAVILLTGSPDSSTSRTTSAPGISLEEWLAGSLSPKSFNATWLSGKCFTLSIVLNRDKCSFPFLSFPASTLYTTKAFLS